MALVPRTDTNGPNNSQGVELTPSRGPRPPVSLQDILRYSVEVGGNAVSQPCELTDEKRQFLENVFKSLSVDVIKELCEALEVLRDIQSGNEKSEADYEVALERIEDFIDNIDFAIDFCKIGGFQVLQPCLDCGYSGVRWRAGDIIAQCTQNNPYCQRAALDMDFLATLMRMSENDLDDTCRVKALYAVACIVRDFQPAYEVFSKLDGFSVLLRLMSANIVKLKLKASFFLSSILAQYPNIKESLGKMGFVEVLVGLAKEGGDLREHVLSSLALLIDGCPQALSIASQPSLQLRSFLHQLIQESSGQDAQKEEVEYAKRILALLCEGDSDGEMEN